MRAVRLLAVFLVLSALFCFGVYADEARDITSAADIKSEGYGVSKITDGNLSTFIGGESIEINISAEEPIGGIYLRFRDVPIDGTVDGIEISQGLLATYTDLSEKSLEKVKITFDSAKICELTVYSVGEIPKDVQLWRTDDTDTDILLLATHSDDDQLFFAGLLPYYARRNDLRVRVAYFVSHNDNPARLHELLSGLWECGVEYYPEIGIFPDAYSESLRGAKQNLAYGGISYGEVIDYQRYLLEKYHPQVVVLHDLAGEYGHGQHILNTQSFIDTLDTAKAEEYLPKKVYIHLYGENKIELPIDEPLSEFGGLTAFRVSQNAFRHHKSQHWTWFYGWLYGKNGGITESTQIKTYNPAYYGLYRTSVGADTEGDDLLENITPYSELERLEAERLERERLEAERLEAERLEAERLEAEREAAFREAERVRESEKRMSIICGTAAIFVILAVTAIIIITKRRKK